MEYQCRICLETDKEENLCNPCKCIGTQKYVHKECLNTFREQFYNFHVHRLYCAVCKTEYKIECESFSLTIDTDILDEGEYPLSPVPPSRTKMYEIPTIMFGLNSMVCFFLTRSNYSFIVFTTQFVQGIVQSFQYSYYSKDCFFLCLSIFLLNLMMVYTQYLLIPTNICLSIAVLCRIREIL
jgi:hypothetical protein